MNIAMNIAAGRQVAARSLTGPVFFIAALVLVSRFR
jgi:Ca2+/H+ antiporter